MRNQIMKRLKNHPYAQAQVRITEDENGVRRAVELISYSTNVCGIYYDEDGTFLECSGTYSQTTRKQIGWFCHEYLPSSVSYYTFKNIVDKGRVSIDEV